MTLDDKISALLRMGFDDGPLAESLARKLSADDIRQMAMEVQAIIDYRIQSLAERLAKMPRQKDRLEEIERLASGWDGGRRMRTS